MKKLFSLLIMTIALFFGAINVVEAAEARQVQALHILVPTEAKAIEIRQNILAGETQSEVFQNFMKAAKMY